MKAKLGPFLLLLLVLLLAGCAGRSVNEDDLPSAPYRTPYNPEAGITSAASMIRPIAP